MKRKLLLIRHAKASHEHGYIDFERPLTTSGIQDAEMMAQRLITKKEIPQLLISSPALRTISTANIFSQHFLMPHAQTNKDIYEASPLTLLKTINNFPDDLHYIGLVGHNPGVSEIHYYLTGVLYNMDTCGVALIEFETDRWADISAGSGELRFHDSPKA